MREIKFRAWDKKNKRWLYFDLNSLVYSSDEGVINIKDWDDTILVNQLNWYLYTGLKDKSGKEIYEGDVVEFLGLLCGQREPMEAYIYYEAPCFEAIAIKPEDISGKGRPLDMRQNQYKIIGNIYENPELLEDRP